MRKLNAVIVGVGHDHAHDCFKYLVDEQGSFNLIGICLVEDDEDNYKLWKDDYDKYPKYTLEETLNLKDLDCVFIESDDRHLSRLAKPFAIKNIPIQLDKPGSQIKEEFDEVLDIVKKNNGVIHLGYMYRYNPAIKEALKLAKDGAFGRILSIETQMNCTHPLQKRKWLKIFKGGMMNFLGCHLIDLILLFLDKPDSVISLNTNSTDDAGDDMSFAVLKYKNNISTVNTTAVEIRGFERRHIVIVAEKATVEIFPTEEYRDGKLYCRSAYKTDGTNPLIKDELKEYGPYHRYKEMYEEFASIIRKQMINPYTVEYEKLLHDVLLCCCDEFGKETKI